MADWIKIEYAPRNGKDCLTYCADAPKPVLVSNWLPDDEDETIGTWRDDGFEPTHWAAIPEAPEAA